MMLLYMVTQVFLLLFVIYTYWFNNQVGHICWLAPPTLSMNLWQARIGLDMKHTPPLSHPPASPH